MGHGIRTVTVELLRKGPPHNQLLSPLTEYIGICGESGAGTVTVPYEQWAFNALLGKLRYPDSEEQDQEPRQQALRSLGSDLGEVLGQIPGLAGKLTESRSDPELLNLRILTSASELSLLPFELAKVPSGTGKPIDDWLALQSASPLCITRRFRSVASSARHWPVSDRPRVLFIVGLDIDDRLRQSHRRILRKSLAPWERGGADPCLVELKGNDATVANIGRYLEDGYPYVHVLAHGAESGATEMPTYGFLLPGERKDEEDVLTGDRFASMLRALPPDVERPSCIVAASCDSAYHSDVIAPGGSFAHYVHLAGVPLVVASQFPLTVDASTTLTEEFYPDILWGNHPLESLARARATLHALYAYTHDWASIVVYDALPDELEQQLDEVRYRRARRALSLAQQVISDKGTTSKPAVERALRAIAGLPTSESYQRECEGLRASHEKQMAEAEYRAGNFDRARKHLMEARKLYHLATRRFLEPRSAIQRYATLHWLQIQSICMDRVMGESVDAGSWWTGYRSATVELEYSGEKYWSFGSLAELWLLRLFDEDLDGAERTAAIRNAESNVRAILDAVPRSHFAVTSTMRQFNRYATLWGDPQFSERLEIDSRLKNWDGAQGVRAIAGKLVKILEG